MHTYTLISSVRAYRAAHQRADRFPTRQKSHVQRETQTHVCLCVRMYVCMYVYMYVYMYVFYAKDLKCMCGNYDICECMTHDMYVSNARIYVCLYVCAVWYRIQLGGERSFPSTSTLSETTGAGSTTSLANIKAGSHSNGQSHTYIHTYILNILSMLCMFLYVCLFVCLYVCVCMYVYVLLFQVYI